MLLKDSNMLLTRTGNKPRITLRQHKKLSMMLKERDQNSKIVMMKPSTILMEPTADKSMKNTEQSSMMPRHNSTLSLKRKELLKKHSTHSQVKLKDSKMLMTKIS